MSAKQFEKDFLARFQFKELKGNFLRVRSDKKVRGIMSFFDIKATDDDLQTGKIFSIKDQYDNDNHVTCAFIKTKSGGLVAGISFRGETSDLTEWIWLLKYERDLTPEDIAEQERRAKLQEERQAERIEKDRQLAEESNAEYQRLKGQIPRTALPPTIVNGLIELALQETNYQRERSPDRRATFAPPIPFSEELVSALERLKKLRPRIEFEPGYGRLWSVWESPKLANGKCKGFDLRAGKAHDGEVIVNIRPGDGSWWTGPAWEAPRVRIECWMGANYVAVQHKAYNEQKERFLLRSELRELGIADILKFSGSPEEVMRAGGRIAGICCRCGRLLTDPTSMALGIGPECIQIVAFELKLPVVELAHRYRQQLH
jgi:hypothetical protein